MIGIKNEDLRLLLQPKLSYEMKIEVIDEKGALVGVLYGTKPNGSFSINSESEIRRTFSISVVPTFKNNISISEQSLIWLNKDIHVYIGVLNLRTNEYKYYSNGYFVFTNTSSQYNSTTNELQISCSDFMCKLDGTKNGQVGALTTIIPAYEEDSETGEVIKYNIIREAFISVLRDLCNITKYMIDDMGEYYAMPDNNPDWEKYRQSNGLWNTIPYDLEFSCGCSVLSILQTLRDLYPNYEMFFDEDNTFVCRMIPSRYDDDIIIANDFLQKILISEDTNLDMTTVRNVCEVWGEVLDTDFYTEDCVLTDDCYECNIDGFEEYGLCSVALKISETNPKESMLNINSLGRLQICDENTCLPLETNYLIPNNTYVFRLKKMKINGEYRLCAIVLGIWQAHGVDVLTDGTVSDEIYITQDGQECAKYSQEYFESVYNCQNVNLTIIPNSPFTVQKLGEILDVKNGGEYENITSDSLALARATYENWKNCRLTDSITITTFLIPFLDVNIKCSYQKNNSDTIKQYIIKSVSHDFSSGTSTISMYKFYPLYSDILEEQGTHKILANYTHGYLSNFTHDELATLV